VKGIIFDFPIPHFSFFSFLFSLEPLYCKSRRITYAANPNPNHDPDEKFAIINKSTALKNAGDEKGASRLFRTMPMPPYSAKVYKEKVGVQELIESGWNLSEAEAEFGEHWLLTN